MNFKKSPFWNVIHNTGLNLSTSSHKAVPTSESELSS